MTKRSVVLGRQGKSGQTADVVLSGSKSISRRHAIVSVVEGTSPPELALSCVGKNHVLVNGEDDRLANNLMQTHKAVMMERKQLPDDDKVPGGSPRRP